MNKRIKKKKEKQALMNVSFEMDSNYSMKKRKKMVNEQWKTFTDSGFKLSTSYRKKVS